MARRSREHRQEIPGYDETRPSRDERKQQHRATRHTTKEMLHSYADPEEIVLPEERRTRKPEGNGNGDGNQEPVKRRYKVWKTKFWKRRDNYKNQKARLDAQWPVVTPEDTEG